MRQGIFLSLKPCEIIIGDAELWFNVVKELLVQDLMNKLDFKELLWRNWNLELLVGIGIWNWLLELVFGIWNCYLELVFGIKIWNWYLNLIFWHWHLKLVFWGQIRRNGLSMSRTRLTGEIQKQFSLLFTFLHLRQRESIRIDGNRPNINLIKYILEE